MTRIYTTLEKKNEKNYFLYVLLQNRRKFFLNLTYNRNRATIIILATIFLCTTEEEAVLLEWLVSIFTGNSRTYELIKWFIIYKIGCF